MTITPIYAGLLGLVFLVLSIRVIRVRRGERVSLGDGGSKILLRRQRAHGNFAEYTPLVLILMALAEIQSAPFLLLHLTGLCLLCGRLSHAYALGGESRPFQFRVAGMYLTFAALLCGSVANLLLPFS
ncbi:MAPEG family protein [Stappia sp. F7233]|uniref:MAPEG family protein n=1 Tax=Stappia albiluteola TaxID=2758565 RepID=A0A839AB36_9HYPH|nr:MAPEG family protein [Stappia albiluteola]MBA5776345.1 MAPEG family protein [Stappia albiluteola]